MSENKLGTMKPLPLVLSMSFPIMLSMALQAVYNIADSLFLSHYSEISFAAVSAVQPVLMIFTALANGLAAGGGSLLSKSLGQGDSRRARGVVATACTLAAAFSSFGMVLVFLASRFITLFFLDGVPGFDDAVSYLRLVSISFPFMFASALASFVLQAHGMGRSAMAVQASGALLNVVLDPVFISVLDMGASGAALATMLGHMVSASVAAVLWLERDVTRARPSFDGSDCKRILSIAFPAAMGQAAGPVVGLVLNKLVLSYGLDAMAVYGMYLKTESFMFLASSGIGSALIVIVGYNYGKGDTKRIRECFFTSLALSWSVMIAGFVFFQLCSGWVVGLFTNSPEVVAMGRSAFRLLCFCFLLTSPNIIMTGLLQGLGMGGRSLMITYCRFFLFLVPSAFVLDRLFGLPGLWLSFFCADVPTFLLIVFIYMKVRRDMTA